LKNRIFIIRFQRLLRHFHTQDKKVQEINKVSKFNAPVVKLAMKNVNEEVFPTVKKLQKCLFCGEKGGGEIGTRVVCMLARSVLLCGFQQLQISNV